MGKKNISNTPLQHVNSFSEEEYESIRTEMIERISTINSVSNTAITTAISTWTAGLALLIFLISKDGVINDYSLVAAGFINSLFFLAPILFFLPLAIKSGENINQIGSISIYIRVFYEYIHMNNYGKELKLFNWELSNNLVSDINVYRGKNSKPLMLYNEEFTILALVSFGMYFATIIVNILRILDTNISFVPVLSIILVYIILIIVAAIFIMRIHKASSIKAFMEKSKYFTRAYINRAIELGLIDKKDFQKAYNYLNPERRLN